MNYDQIKRNPVTRAFYNSKNWKLCRRIKLRETPWCERCGNLAQHVHHRTPIATPAGWDLRLDHDGLMSVCIPCHNTVEAEGEPFPFVAGTLDLAESELYWFDGDAASRPIRFIERFCKHYEGRFAGQPFILHPVQRKIIADIYGWKCRDTNHRRFSQVWMETAAGGGKSPLLAALGIFGLMADGEQGAEIYSLASNYPQARIVFDAAKKYIEAEKELNCRLRVLQYHIEHRASNSVWRVISGKGPKAGMRPHMALGDEVHEWPNREVYDSIQGRMTKRTQPLFFCATNAGESRSSLAWALHEEAAGVLLGTRVNPALYPIIWAAPKDDPIDDPKTWAKANPLLGVTIQPEKIRIECQRSKDEPALEARFRRLYLSQWVQGAQKWLDLTRWEACTATLDREILKDAPLYSAVDLSRNDDLTSVVYVWVTANRFYVDAEFWMPKSTAMKYETRDAIPYTAWAKAGAIHLLDELTITPDVQVEIANSIIDRSHLYHLQAVCYDRAYDEQCTATLEAAGIDCRKIGQGWGVSPGCSELDRRLKESSMTIAPNPVLKSHAEVVEVKFDERGNYWPVKPNAKASYAGKRSAKIDGIAALVTALTEARKHNFPAAQKQWTGTVVSI